MFRLSNYFNKSFNKSFNRSFSTITNHLSKISGFNCTRDIKINHDEAFIYGPPGIGKTYSILEAFKGKPGVYFDLGQDQDIKIISNDKDFTYIIDLTTDIKKHNESKILNFLKELYNSDSKKIYISSDIPELLKQPEKLKNHDTTSDEPPKIFTTLVAKFTEIPEDEFIDSYEYKDVAEEFYLDFGSNLSWFKRYLIDKEGTYKEYNRLVSNKYYIIKCNWWLDGWYYQRSNKFLDVLLYNTNQFDSPCLDITNAKDIMNTSDFKNILNTLEKFKIIKISIRNGNQVIEWYDRKARYAYRKNLIEFIKIGYKDFPWIFIIFCAIIGTSIESYECYLRWKKSKEYKR